MNNTEQCIFEAALGMPPQSRAQRADILWASLPEEELDVPIDDEIRRSWADELRRRKQDVDDGKVSLLSGDEVMQRLRARIEK